jgi:NAD(P)H dehydrogenase (quinone)
MAKVVIYYSRTGNTKRMAEKIAEGAGAICKSVNEVTPKELLDYEAIVIGSPTQYGSMAWEVKKLLDDTAGLHNQLDGKVGGAFSSSGTVGGGSETTILDILHAMLIHGMIIQGEPKNDHYGITSVGFPSEETLNKCLRYGTRIAELCKR